MSLRHCLASAAALCGALGLLFTAGCNRGPEQTKLGFLVKQPEEPWFQYEWKGAEKAGAQHGFTVVKLGVTDGEKVIMAIRRVLSGSVYVSDSLAAKMLQQQVRGHTDVQQPAIKSLSDREVEVFHLIGQWKKTKEIAGELHLSVKTVEYYREQIKRKLNLKDAAELTQYATAWVQREVPA